MNITPHVPATLRAELGERVAVELEHENVNHAVLRRLAVEVLVHEAVTRAYQPRRCRVVTR